MKNIIIGTAGHVDHGKTLLIKTLSGIDTDRLSEEKKRGITIELGFAHIPNDDGYNIGVIDVPGHEKFIKNMLAGIGGVDFVIFVVAADEGIMPQTKEHFEILQALGIDDGIIAITKTDMVEADWLEMMIEDVKDYFKGSFLEGKPIVPVSARTGDNIDKLKEEIIKKCDRPNKRLEDKELFRLPVDRVFSMQGFGTVVTGTLMDGVCNVGDEITIFPGNMHTKIRGIQTYGNDTEEAVAGQRTAINLSNITKEDISRGDVIAMEHAVTETMMLDVQLKIFNASDKAVLNNSRVHFYCGSKEAICKVILLDRDVVNAGETCYAQLRFEEPIALRRGDRFIVRFYSPIITIGGGRVLDVQPDKHKRNREDVLAKVELLENGELASIIEMKAGQRKFYKKTDLGYELGILPDAMNKACTPLLQKEIVIELADSTLLSKEKFKHMKVSIEHIINEYHEANPLVDGIPKQELLSRLKAKWFIEDEKLIQSLIALLLEKAVLADKGKTLALKDFAVEYSEEQQKKKEKIVSLYTDAGFELIKNDVIFELDKDRNMLSAMLVELADDEIIKKIDAQHYIIAIAWNQAVNAIIDLKEFTLAEFRDKLGTSRKNAELILSASDKAGYTRMTGSKRTALVARS